MKQFSKTRIMCTMMLLAASAVFSSFTARNGGEGFEIFLNNKVVLQQFGNKMGTVSTIQLDQRLSGDQLVVKYYHCGRVGKNRSIAIRDAQNKVLKEWKFANASASGMTISDAAMACKVKEILSLQKGNPGKLGLYYTCDEIPKGRLLVNLATGDLARSK